MDGGSLDKLVPPGVGIRNERILAWVTSCTVRGLKYLKDNLNIIHRGMHLPFPSTKPVFDTLITLSPISNSQTSNQPTSS
jgi:hypothetical protein